MDSFILAMILLATAILIRMFFTHSEPRIHRTCPRCLGGGFDHNHHWPDETPASCERCEGVGTIEISPYTKNTDNTEDYRE